jgi:serine/threonine protein kinase/Tfp pilus assembly protein PilF
MKSKNWSHVEEVLQDALDCAPDERAAYLDQACAGDEALRLEVESLLSAYAHSDGFMAEHLSQVVAELITEDQTGAAAVGELVGSYKILSPLGAGGMGEVYLAQDMKLGRKVALKLLPADLSRDENRLHRFEQEARLASNLTHPNICVIHEVNETEDGRHFIVMEYVDGVTLREYMAEKQLGLSEVLDIVMQVASALSAAHEVGIVHRDIKPENIMVRHDGYIKVLDFGLAKLAEDNRATSKPFAPTKSLVETGAGVVIGTVCYMSPEQARGLPVDARTDIFSLGCVLYELVTGELPFAGETMSDCLAAILKTEPAPLSHYAEEVPAELERIVHKALEKDGELRYQVIQDFALALKTLRHDLDVQTEIERSASPTKAASTAESRTRVSAKNGSANTDDAVDATSTTSAVARPTSSAEYLLSEIKRHKLAASIVLAALALVFAGLFFYLRNGNSSGAIDSIAVLPFDNQNHDPASEYLSDGVTESIINNLTRLQNLRVIPRSTVFRYKGRETDPLTVGRELGVRAVLTGRVLQRGDSLIISAELIDVRDNKQLWGEQYSRKVADALSVQQEISREISDHLRLKLPGEEQEQVVKHQTNNPEAYQHYLRGRYYWNKRTQEYLKKAVEEFQQAVDKDPNYALAYAGLADCYAMLEEYDGKPASEIYQKAKAFAERALQIDNSLAEAHASLAQINEHLWQWNDAEREFKRALELNPNYATAHQWYSFYFQNLGRFDEALVEIKRAQELDPLSLIINANVAGVYLLQGNLNSAMEQCNKLIELDPNYPGGHDVLAFVYLKQRRYPEAIAEVQKTVELSRSAGNLSDLGYIYAIAGRRNEALSILRELEEKYARHEAAETDVATIYVGLGDKDQAFVWLEKGFQAHSGVLPYIGGYLQWETLRTDPRYADLMQRMGLMP